MSFATHEEIAKIYFSKLNLNPNEDLNEQNISKIIKSAYQDFRNEELPFDDFSTLGEFLFNKLSPSLKTSNLGTILLDIAELSEHIRVGDYQKSLVNFTDAIKSIDQNLKNF